MADKYVSKTDLEYYHGRIKTVFATQTALDDKVDKVSGKGLSTNDYTTAEKNKLAGISAGAQVNVIESVKRNGTALTVTNKAVDVSVPTKVSDLTNDSGFITSGDIPQASTTTPAKDGTASAGTENAWARGDHVHPTDTSRAAASHTHGNITNAGAITATAVDPANNDALVMTDNSASGKIVKSTIAFDGSTTNQFLTKKGTFGGVSADDVAFESQDPIFADALDVFDALDALANRKVDIVVGKGLSTNDYTTDEKNKLAGIEAGAQVNTINSGSIAYGTTTSATVTNKVLTLTLKLDSAMSSTSTDPVQNKVVKKYIDDAIAGVTSFDIQVVTSLPTTGSKGVIYLVAHSHGTQDAYDEYIWTGSAYEKIGSTDIDLSGYWAKSELTAMTTAEIDALFE
jgi:hypothetical protein